jgi:anthranilate/para-aminobenzoate synthase component I
VTDPWTTFARAAEDRDVAGYFETAPRGGERTGRAVAFLTASEVRTVTAHTSPEDEAQHVRKFLRGGRGRAVIGFLGFDAVGLFEPRLRTYPAGDPFPLGSFALVDRPTRTRVVRQRSPRPPGGAAPSGPPLQDSLARPAFERSVRRLVEEIRNGEAYQVVLGHRRAWKRPQIGRAHV